MQDKIEMVTRARGHIIATKKQGSSAGEDFDLVAQMKAEAAARSEAMMKAEVARMEGLRRRQEKEINLEEPL